MCELWRCSALLIWMKDVATFYVAPQTLLYVRYKCAVENALPGRKSHTFVSQKSLVSDEIRSKTQAEDNGQ